MPITNGIMEQTALKYPEIKTYIETGTGWGDSLRTASKFFQNLYTIDILDRKNTADNYKANFFLGDSSIELAKILEKINDRCFIYLDAHIIGNEGKDLPLLKELEIIGSHKIKNHIITIDDMRLIKGAMKLSREIIETAIKNINPNYTISYKDDGYDKEDILVAEV